MLATGLAEELGGGAGDLGEVSSPLNDEEMLLVWKREDVWLINVVPADSPSRPLLRVKGPRGGSYFGFVACPPQPSQPGSPGPTW